MKSAKMPGAAGPSPYIGGVSQVDQKMRHPFILSGYRVNFISTRLVFRSLFMLHNQTVNIWLHLGFFLVVLLAMLFFQRLFSQEDAIESFLLFIRLRTAAGLQNLEHLSNILLLYGQDTLGNVSAPRKLEFAEAEAEARSVSRLPIMIFLTMAALCLLCSSLYHLFMQKSLRTKKVMLRLDYAGINFLISGTTIPAVYYSFYCKPFAVQFLCGLSVTLALLLFCACLTDYFHDDRRRTLKGCLYGLFGVCSSFPLAMNINDPQDPFQVSVAYPLYLCMGACYLGGLVIYSMRCPERFHPGQYDICGHSHQIWHLAVILGMLFALAATLMCYYQRQIYPHCLLQ